MKYTKKNKRVFIHEITQLIIMKMKMKMKNRSHRYGKIDLGLDMKTNIVNKKSVSVWLCVLSNTQATFEAQFMQKLSNTEAELKKSVAYNKPCSRSGLRTLRYYLGISEFQFITY